MVPAAKSSASQHLQRSPSSCPCAVPHSPVNSPVHDVVCGDEWRYNVEDLCAGSSPRVEDGRVGCTGEWVLAVRGETVGDDALLGLSRGACVTDVAVSTQAVSSIVQKWYSKSILGL